jgi:hypothetical protein
MERKLGREGDLVGINGVDKMWITFGDLKRKGLDENDKKNDKGPLVKNLRFVWKKVLKPRLRSWRILYVKSTPYYVKKL